MHFTSTDFPVPEPPMMTRLSLVAQSMSTPSSTRLRPKDFISPRTDIFGIAVSAISSRFSPTEEGCSNHVIEDENQDRGRHNCVGRRLTYALRPAARVIAVVAAHQRYDEAEYGGFHQTRNNIARLEILLGSV